MFGRRIYGALARRLAQAEAGADLLATVGGQMDGDGAQGGGIGRV